MNTASSLYQTETIDTIREIFTNALGCQVVHQADLMKGGLFNTTYKVTYDVDYKIAVLRLGPVNRHLLPALEVNLMEAENYVCQILKEHGIPVSHVLACDTSKKVVDRDYMIVDYIPSVPMSLVKMETEKKAVLHEMAGKYTAVIHQIKGETFGHVSRILEGGGKKSWGEYLLVETKDILTRCLAGGHLDTDEVNLIGDAMKKHIDLLNEVKTPYLIHGDIWEGNLLIRENGIEYELTALIDGDRAVYGDIDYELSTPWMINDAFLKGYQLDREEFEAPDRQKRRQIYLMFISLFETYVNGAEYNNSKNYEHNKEKVLRLAREILKGSRLVSV